MKERTEPCARCGNPMPQATGEPVCFDCTVDEATVTLSGNSHERTVMIATPSGSREVRGEVYGLWAVTPRILHGRPDYDFWTMTHVPTGRSYGGLAFPDKDSIRRYVRWLAEQFAGPEWDTEDVTAIPPDEQERFVRAYLDYLAGAYP